MVSRLAGFAICSPRCKVKSTHWGGGMLELEYITFIVVLFIFKYKKLFLELCKIMNPLK